MRNDIIVSKMLNYINKIFFYIKSLNYEDFINQDVIVEACVFNLSQLGELATR